MMIISNLTLQYILFTDSVAPILNSQKIRKELFDAYMEPDTNSILDHLGFNEPTIKLYFDL